MRTFSHIATSSKLLRTLGFFSEEEAAAQAQEWEAEAPTGRHDVESPATVYTWAEWVAIAESNECDPLDGVQNAE